MGEVTTANSLVGSHANDRIGIGWTGVHLFSGGIYAVQSPTWDSGAVTWASSDLVGPITSQNSILGAAASGGYGMNAVCNEPFSYPVVGRPADNKITLGRLVMSLNLPLVTR